MSKMVGVSSLAQVVYPRAHAFISAPDGVRSDEMPVTGGAPNVAAWRTKDDGVVECGIENALATARLAAM